jgi:histone H3/H4
VSQAKSSSHKSSKPSSGTKRPAVSMSQGIPKGSVKRLMTNEEAVDRVSADAITLVAKAAVSFYAQYSHSVCLYPPCALLHYSFC